MGRLLRKILQGMVYVSPHRNHPRRSWSIPIHRRHNRQQPEPRSRPCHAHLGVVEPDAGGLGNRIPCRHLEWCVISCSVARDVPVFRCYELVGVAEVLPARSAGRITLSFQNLYLLRRCIYSYGKERPENHLQPTCMLLRRHAGKLFC